MFDETVDAGESSGIITINFANAVVGGFQGGITFDTGVAVDSFYETSSVPEPGSALLMGALLAAGLVVRRR